MLFFLLIKRKKKKISVLFNLLTLKPCTSSSTHESQCPHHEAGAVTPAWWSRENPVTIGHDRVDSSTERARFFLERLKKELVSGALLYETEKKSHSRFKFTD